MRHLRWASATLTTVLVLAGCGSNAPTSSTIASSPSASSSSTTSTRADPLDGTIWRSSFTCDEVSKALEGAGLQKYEAHVLRPDNLGHCDETMHTTLKFSDGELSSMGGSVPYQMINDHTYVAGFLRNTYHMLGNRLIFTDTRIIAELYPYDTKIMPGEHAFDVGVLMAAPFVRVN